MQSMIYFSRTEKPKANGEKANRNEIITKGYPQV